MTVNLFRKLIKEKYKKHVLPKPIWFTSFNRDFDYINGGRNWEYCTVCGNEPAIINFSKNRNGDDYSEQAKCEILRLAFQYGYKVTDEQIENLKVWFKPGEKLGPLCIIKRGLYYRLRNSLKVFRSTDDIAYSYYKEVIEPIVKDSEECNKLKEFLNAEESDVYETFENPIKARRIFNKCAELNEKKLACIQKDYGVSEVTDSFKKAIKGYREFYAIIKADADDMTELARGEIEAEKYFEILSKLLKYGEICKDSRHRKNSPCKYLIYTYTNMTSIAYAINNGYILMSPTYRVALSTAMMITLLRDIKTVEVENHGQIIYAGGDDVVALVPIDRLIDTLIGLEKNFVREDGFFTVRNWYIPSISPHGRSFSVRISNIADFMTNEIQTATELLNKVKTVEWNSDRNSRKKFSVIISSSRTNYVSILPVWDFKYLELVKKMWLLNLSGILSSSVFEDYEIGFKKLINGLSDRVSTQLIKSLINYVVIRNKGEDLKKDFEIDVMHITGRDYESNIFDEIFKAFRLMRGVL
ncbi:type III-B CRISPR-associated protein Cas10/Cmr2 [Saccharolobus islandicus]|uniref:type III-B CRISPR-associated protein Cas10/Cmr2 n=1 Tax=Saccharolobus islandicus TaxID=43080 RepID=UPI0023A99C44|nr:type III-B CRISPR-associated protein Cas10/Cmr2 [Sulfolobus islandicus]